MLWSLFVYFIVPFRWNRFQDIFFSTHLSFRWNEDFAFEWDKKSCDRVPRSGWNVRWVEKQQENILFQPNNKMLIGYLANLVIFDRELNHTNHLTKSITVQKTNDFHDLVKQSYQSFNQIDHRSDNK